MWLATRLIKFQKKLASHFLQYIEKKFAILNCLNVFGNWNKFKIHKMSTTESEKPLKMYLTI